MKRLLSRSVATAMPAQPWLRSENIPVRAFQWRCILAVGLAVWLWGSGSAFAIQSFRAGDWVAECRGNPRVGAAECSVTVPFWQNGYRGKGSFALVVMVQTGDIGVVGQPMPVKAVLRIDKNPAIECREARYCVFPPMQSIAVVRELQSASLILIDVATAQSQFHFSLSPKGYQAAMAQIRAWGYRSIAN